MNVLLAWTSREEHQFFIEEGASKVFRVPKQTSGLSDFIHHKTTSKKSALQIIYGISLFQISFTTQLDVIRDRFLCSNRSRAGENGVIWQGDAEHLSKL